MKNSMTSFPSNAPLSENFSTEGVAESGLFQFPNQSAMNELKRTFKTLGIPQKYIHSSNVRRSLQALMVHKKYELKAKALLQLCQSYGETPLKTGLVIKGSEDVFQHYKERLSALQQEVFLVILLDQKHRMLKELFISQGSLSRSIVHPRDVFAPAILHRSAAILCVHNHPSGDCTPSPEDRKLTQRLVEAGKLLGIPLIDHLIIGDGVYTSFSDHALL